MSMTMFVPSRESHCMSSSGHRRKLPPNTAPPPMALSPPLPFLFSPPLPSPPIPSPSLPSPPDKNGGSVSEDRKPRSLKSGGLKPSSLIEIYAYASGSLDESHVSHRRAPNGQSQPT